VSTPRANPETTIMPASTLSHRTSTIATEIANKVGGNVTVRDVLRWKKEYASARSGGTRDPLILYNNLKITKPGSWKLPVILVDDVLTSGGHLMACTAILRENGARVDLAVCAGRTVQESPRNPFEVQVEEVEDFEP